MNGNGKVIDIFTRKERFDSGPSDYDYRGAIQDIMTAAVDALHLPGARYDVKYNRAQLVRVIGIAIDKLVEMPEESRAVY